MKDGIVQQLGSPEEIYNKPANTFVAGFMGSPAMNLLDGELVGHDDSIAVQLGGAGDEQALLPLPATFARDSLQPCLKIKLGLRPETVTDPVAARALGGEKVHLDCLVEVAEPTGADIYASTRLGGQPVTARLRAGLSLAAGEHSEFAIDMSKAVLFDAATEQRIA